MSTTNDILRKFREMCELYAATYTKEELDGAGSVTDARTLHEAAIRGAYIINAEQSAIRYTYVPFDGWAKQFRRPIIKLWRKEHGPD